MNQHSILYDIRNESNHIATKKSDVSEWHKKFKESWHVKITNEDNAHRFLQY